MLSDFSSLYGRFLNWFLTTKFWKKIGKFCATFNFRFFGYVKFPIDDYFKIIDMCDKNKHYAFLSTDSKTISSMLIKLSIFLAGDKKQGYGLFSHAGLILFDGERNTKAMHVSHANFQYQSLLSHLKEIDYFAVIEIPVIDGKDEIVKSRIEHLRSKADEIKYDWEESLDNDELHIYCSELLYLIFKDIVPGADWKPRRISGKDYFDPDMLLQLGKIVYTNHPGVLNKVLATL